MDSDSAVSKKITLHHTKALTVFAFHPTERIVVAGDITGRILIWRGFGSRKFLDRSGLVNGISADDEDACDVRENDDAKSCEPWHWHSFGVRLLSFSSDGAYLYSGKFYCLKLITEDIELGNVCLYHVSVPKLSYTC